MNYDDMLDEISRRSTEVSIAQSSAKLPVMDRVLETLDKAYKAISDLADENNRLTNPDVVRINMLERIKKRADEHGGIDHLVALDEAAMTHRLIILPDRFYVGQKIFVIEGEYRTGNPTTVIKNTVMGFDHAGIYYRYDSSTPVYHERWENFNKIFFVDRETADKVFKENYS